MELPISPCAWCGDTLYIGGTAPIEQGEVLFAGDWRKQTEYVVGRLASILEENGLSLEELVMVQVYLASLEWFEEFNKVYGSIMARPYPPRKLMEAKMSREGVLVELSAIAGKHKKREEVDPCPT